MRIVNGVFCLLLILFTAVQYNDPDFLLWGLFYGIGAVFTGMAAYRPGLFVSSRLAAVFALCLVASIGGVYYYWPTTPSWWMQDVWWQTETAREGMGMMIVTTALLITGFTVLRVRRG
ncbi:MAG: transmembrane 220 family protein [Limibaculum sp.]